MKIMIVAPFDVKGRFKGGISSIANTIVENQSSLARLGLNVITFDTCRIQRMDSKEGSLSKENFANAFSLYKDIIKAINETKPDILYYHTSVKTALLKDLLVARHAKLKTHIPIILHIHFADYNKIMIGNKTIDSIIISLLRRFIDRIIFLSERTKTEYIEHGIPCDKCHVVYNFSSISCNKNEIKTENTNRQFVFIGSIDKRKGIFDLLKTISNLDGDYVLHICGECRTKEEEKEFSSYLDKKKYRIIHHGYVGENEKKQILTQADALVLPSYGEGLPMVIMEALSTGCYIISTNVGAIPEIVGSSNGILIAPGDNKSLLTSMKNVLLMNNDDLQSIKLKNLKESEKYTFETFIQQIVSISQTLHKDEIVL